MRFWIKILIAVVAAITMLFIATYLFIAFRGKSLITDSLRNLTNRKVTIGYLDLRPPLHIKIINLEIEGLAKVDSIHISPSLLGMLTGNIAFNNIQIIKPEITYERSAGPDASAPAVSPAPETVSPAAEAVIVSQAPGLKSAAKPPLRLIFKRLNIKDGRINFIDHTVGKDGIKITIKDINFNLTNLYLLPYSVMTGIDLKGRIPWQAGKEEGKIEAKGWLNLHKKDIQLSVKIKDIDGIYLYPYYSQWVDLEKARIESAKLNFTSNIHGMDNNITAECHLELTNIVRKPRPPEEEQEKAEKIADAVLDVFRALNQGNIVLDFTIRTKMDRPEFGFGNIKMAVEDKLAKARGKGLKTEDILMLPGRLMESAVRSTTNISKAVIDGVFAIGNGVKKGVEDSFKKEKK